MEKRLKRARLRQMTHALHRSLSIDGRSFSQALREFPRIFPPLYVNMVAAGEASGALPDILLSLVEHLMQAKNLRDRVQLALIYRLLLPSPASASHHRLHHVHGAATGRVHGANETGARSRLPTQILLRVHHLVTGLIGGSACSS